MLFYKEEKKKISERNAWQSKMSVYLRDKNFHLIVQKMYWLCNPREEKLFFICKPECGNSEEKMKVSTETHINIHTGKNVLKRYLD